MREASELAKLFNNNFGEPRVDQTCVDSFLLVNDMN